MDWKKVSFDFERDVSVDGLFALEPVIYTGEILGRETTILRCYGSHGKQVDFPLTVDPEWIADNLAADPISANVWAIASCADMANSDYGINGYHAKVHSKELQENNFLVCGEIVRMRFLFEVILIVQNGKLIKPSLYFKKKLCYI